MGANKKIYGRDSDGRIIAIERKHLRTLLKNRLAIHVEPEVKEIVAKLRRKGIRRFSVQDLSLELGVRFATVRLVLNNMVTAGDLKAVDRHDAQGVYEMT